ncbi:OprO/OprP family phosphate-selective porin [Entomobacter blattae]|uniref:Phosphate-selective porin O and P n=1 Tax=Entomobacter blattae TaxID=2762277 RepID=A0A7H1NNV7_9PROT|nr:porin [Entomobacter blattae]QNT77467.1 Phosphate-selective porin O and P [Entomobacter blattae]
MQWIDSRKITASFIGSILCSTAAYAAPPSSEHDEIIALKKQMLAMAQAMTAQISSLKKELAHVNAKMAQKSGSSSHNRTKYAHTSTSSTQVATAKPAESVEGQASHPQVAAGPRPVMLATAEKRDEPVSAHGKKSKKPMVVEHLDRPPPDRGASFWSPDMPLIQTASVKDESVHIGGITIGFPGGRPTIASDDGHYSLAIGLAFHEDFGGFLSTAPREGEKKGDFKSFTQNARRLRIPFTFRYDTFAANVTPEYGGSPDGKVTLYEGNLQYGGLENTILTIGYFQPRVTLEDSESSNEFQFLERPEISEIARNIAAGDARFSVGGITYGDQWYIGAYLTGHSFGRNTNDPSTVENQTGGVFRVAGRPIASKDWDMHLGLSASSAFQVDKNSGGRLYSLGARPESRLTSDRLVTTGTLKDVSQIWEAGPEFAVRWDRALLKAEYIHIGVNRDGKGEQGSLPNLNFQGYYVSAGYTIFGKPRAYDIRSAAFRAPGVEEDFNPTHGNLGALEAQARWSVVDLNDKIDKGGVQGGKQDIVSLGLNWSLNRHFRVMLDYSHIHASYSDGNPINLNGRSLDSVVMRVQSAF